MDENLKKGIELIKQVENSEAIIYLEKALASNSNEAEIHRHLGLAYNNIGNSEKTLFHWKQAVTLDPTHHQTLWSLGNLYESNQDYKMAFDLYSRATHNAKTVGDITKAKRYEEWAKKVKKEYKNES